MRHTARASALQVLGTDLADLEGGCQVQAYQHFQMVLNQRATRALGFAQERANGQWRGWAPFLLRRIRTVHTRTASHLDLSDDVISMLYDPQGQRNQWAAFALANVPRYGLMQLYGGIADAPEPLAAVRAALRGSLRLHAALLGRFRQSLFTFFTPDEGAAYYNLLWDCECTAALIGQLVPRVKAGLGGMQSGTLAFGAVQDAQEQLEVIAAGIGPVPYAVVTQVEPLAAPDIRSILLQTADILSHYASRVRGQEQASLSAAIPLWVNPTGAVMQQQYRSAELGQAQRRLYEERSGQRVAAGQSSETARFAQAAESGKTYAGSEAKQYRETQHIAERLGEREHSVAQLERAYSETYQAHKSYAGSEAGSLHESGVQRLTESGQRGQQVGEQGQLYSVEGLDEATHGNRYGAGGRSESTAFSESAAYSGGSTRQWSGDYTEQSERAFTHSGQDQEARNYENVIYRATTENGQEAFNRQQTQDQRQDVYRQDQFAEQQDSARFVPGMMGMGAGTETATGQRGNIVNERALQDASVDGGGQSHRQLDTGIEERGAGLEDVQYQRDGTEAESLARQWTGNERAATSEWRSGGGTRSSQTGYGYTEAYGDTRRVDRTSDRAWESEVASEADWQQEVAATFARDTAFARTFSGTLSETGSRAGQLVQADVLTAERHLERDIARSTEGARSEEVSGQLRQTETSRGAAVREEAMIGTGREYATTLANSQAGGLISSAGLLQASTRGVAGPSGGSLIGGLSWSRSIEDAVQAQLAELLQLQVSRCRAGLNTGLFLTQVTLFAPNATILEQLGAAAIAAFREEEAVVAPVALRAGDATLWAHAVRLEFDPRKEPAAFIDTYQHAQVLTSNELAALTHPLRLSSGTISASLEPWPENLSRRHTQGELPLGEVLDLNLQPDPDNVYRISRDKLMHTVIVGDSGSGKSNAAFWLVAQIVNRLRVDAQGHPLPTETYGPLTAAPTGGRAAIGCVIFDPTGEWRKLSRLLHPQDFRFYSLTEPDYHHLHFNPLCIPSPHIDPAMWAATVAKQWLLAYPAGGTAFNLLKGAALDAYRAAGVIDELGAYYPARSQDVTMSDLRRALGEKLAELKRTREDNISAGVAKRIYDKLEEYLPGGVYYRAYGRAGGTGVAEWVDPHRATVITGKFGDDGPLKQFIVGLMVAGIFAHADGAYDYYLRNGLPVPETLIFVEEAHVVMRSDAASQTETAQAIGEDAGLWNNITDRGRKLGLYLFTSAQHWAPLPAGVVTSTALVIAQKTSTLEDAEIAVPKLGQLPGKTSIDEYSKWTLKLLKLPTGVGFVRRTRETLEHEEGMEIFPVQFYNLSAIAPPSDAELDYVLRQGGALC